MTIYCLILSVLLLNSVNTGESVRCYSCSSQESISCLKPDKHNVKLVNCDLKTLEQTKKYAESIRPEYGRIFGVDANDISRQLDLNCLKQVTKEGNKEMIIRGCQLAEQTQFDICHKVRTLDNDVYKTMHCSRCGTEGCNAASQNFPTTALTFSVLLALVYKLLFH